MRKLLVAFRRPVYDEVERLLKSQCSDPRGDERSELLDEALLAIRQARAVYDGGGPVRLANKGELTNG